MVESPDPKIELKKRPGRFYVKHFPTALCGRKVKEREK
jgi:hypothetical protein